MVFSQTSHKTRNILKVVDLDCLKITRSELENGSDRAFAEASISTAASSQATTSYSEVRTTPNTKYLKSEPETSTMFYNNSDCEYFQDLVQWCSDPVKDEQQLTTESAKATEEGAKHTDTQTLFPTLRWDVFDAKSPTDGQVGYCSTPNPLSPSMETGFAGFDILQAPELGACNQFPEQFLDISSLPVVIEDSASETAKMSGWNENPLGWNTHTHTKQSTHSMPFINQEDSLDIKYMTPVTPHEVESNDVIISEFILNEGSRAATLDLQSIGAGSRLPMRHKLDLDVSRAQPEWSADIISTPEVLTYVEQLENEKCLSPEPPVPWGEGLEAEPELSLPAPLEYEPITPKTESHIESEEDSTSCSTVTKRRRRRRDSEDSDETYTPYEEQPAPKKYKKRKPNISIKDMITALEGSPQLTKARRGRPPKRRDSTVSSVCSIDDSNSMVSTQDGKYRELRDKNNEASKRSRMNRKLKELQMEQMAIDLEERNKKLQVRADILEDMTKKLKDALMMAILQK